MSAEQFNHIENSIKIAAEHSEPAYNEQAWELMNAKLDKEEEGKKRFFLWFVFSILSILLIVVAGFLFFDILKVPRATANENFKKLQSAHLKDGLNNSRSLNISQQRELKKSDPLLITNAINQGKNRQDKKVESVYEIGKKTVADKTSISSFSKKIKEKVTLKITNAAIGEGKGAYDLSGETVAIDENEKIEPSIYLLPFTKETTPAKFKITSAALYNFERKAGINLLPEGAKDKRIKTDRQSKKKIINTSGSFYLMGTIGADAASVKLFKYKNTTAAAKYGVGVGYQLTRKISLQTGFFTGYKKYIAGPNDYLTKDDLYWRQVQLIKVGAACLVYEIPLAVRFDFLQKSSYKLYATTGLSSYFMKKEVYDYHYFRNSAYQESGWTYTGNKSMFSILTFSAGIEKKLSNNFSLTVEPSVGLPLAGVGDGRIKLFSTALQIGFKYQPIKKHLKN